MRELTLSYRETDHNIHAHELYALLFALILLRPTELWTTQGCETGPTVYPKTGESNFVQISLLSSQLLRDP